ncbi:MAG: hypothetical protein EOO69_06975 [Moraxellaceae bacterium]|nr:MAG: hypothetical protein EOO69_06975 [Moraxellaceae bacterium]
MHASSSASQLPSRIEPFKWAEQGFSWSGLVPLSRFARIASEATVPAGQSDTDALTVQVDCRLYMDEYQRIAWLDGTLVAIVPMTCQRCLELVEVPVATEVHLALLTAEKQIARLDEDADFVILSEEQVVHGVDDAQMIDLIELLEDELLLSVPISPRHDECENRHQPVVEDEPEQIKRDNPFEALANLKGKLDS